MALQCAAVPIFSDIEQIWAYSGSVPMIKIKMKYGQCCRG